MRRRGFCLRRPMCPEGGLDRNREIWHAFWKNSEYRVRRNLTDTRKKNRLISIRNICNLQILHIVIKRWYYWFSLKWSYATSYVTFIEKWISWNIRNRAIFLYGYGIVKHTIYIDRVLTHILDIHKTSYFLIFFK